MGQLGKGLNRKEVRSLVDGITRRGFVGGAAGLAALATAGGLRPGVTAAEALNNLGILPDDLPASWNQAMPQLVIAGVKFS